MFDVAARAQKHGLWAQPGTFISIESRQYRSALMALCAEAISFGVSQTPQNPPISEATRRSLQRYKTQETKAQAKYETAKLMLPIKSKLQDIVISTPINVSKATAMGELSNLRDSLVSLIEQINQGVL